MSGVMSPKQKKKGKKNEPGSPGGDQKGGMLAAKVRGMVSMNKVRLQEGGFDLDLTYITENVIAMGFPSHGTEGYYRNPVDKVEQFFNERHANQFRIYNLCSERKYDKDGRFNKRYKRFPFDDHNAPAPISIIPDFVNDVKNYLAEKPGNVAAIHCKAGKGRTGVVIACYLMAMFKEYRKPKDALERFASLRTRDGEGVTIPSQHRYVGYWDKMLSKYNGEVPPAPPLKIDSITVSGGAQWDLFMTVNQGPERMGADPAQVFDSRKNYSFKSVSTGNGTYSYPISSSNVVVRGDVKVTFKASHRLRSSEHLFHFWFHTAFTQTGPHTFTKMLLDKAAKDKKHNLFKPNLSVTMTITEAPEECRLRGESTFFNDDPASESEPEEEEEEEEEEEGEQNQPPYSPVTPIEDLQDDPVFPTSSVATKDESPPKEPEPKSTAPKPEPVEVAKRVTNAETVAKVETATVVEKEPTPTPPRTPSPEPVVATPQEEVSPPSPVPVTTEPDPPREETAAEKRLRELKEQREKRQREREVDKERRERERKVAEEERKDAAARREAELREKAAAREREREERKKAREAGTAHVQVDEKPPVEPVTASPVLPPSSPSPTSTDSVEVVNLAHNIIQRIRAIEKTCSKHHTGQPPTLTAPAPSSLPLPFIAMSLLERSSRLEIMCTQESELREIKNKFRAGTVG